MISMKKTAMAAALAMTMGAGVAQAQFPPLAGNFTVWWSDGALVGQDTGVRGYVFIDRSTGTGVASFASAAPFFGYYWTARSITLQATGPATLGGGFDTVHADMLFDWNDSSSHVTMDFSILPNIPDRYGYFGYTLTTLDGLGACVINGTTCLTGYDGPGDGIPGNPIDNGPFTGLNFAFNGTTVAPVPAAIWLLGSGLLGLMGIAGVARRHQPA